MTVRRTKSLGMILYVALLSLGLAGISLVQAASRALPSGTWSTWHKIPMVGKTDAAPFAICYSGKLWLFTKGMVDGRIYLNTFDAYGWSGYSDVVGDITTTLPVGGNAYGNNLYLYASNSVTHRLNIGCYIDGHWSCSFGELSADTQYANFATCALMYGQDALLFLKGCCDTQIYWRDNMYGHDNNWYQVPGDFASDTAVNGCVWAGQLWLFDKRNSDNSALFYSFNRNGSWLNSWGPVVNSVKTDVSAATAVYKNSLFIFEKGKMNNRIYSLRSHDPSVNFWARAVVPGMLTKYALSAAVYNGKLYLFAIAGDQSVWYSVFSK